MAEMLTAWLGREGYLPHGYCFTWSPGLLWSMVGADAVIAASYYSIPIVLIQFARRRRDVRFNWILLLFSAFIFACGTTHVLAIWTIWQPDYGLETIAKLLTAAVSLLTAMALWPLLPKALAVPSTRQLQAVIDSLEAEVQLRRSVQENLVDVEQRLAVTLASIGAGFIAADRAGRVVRMNEFAEEVTGWTQQQAAGRPLWEVFVSEDRTAHYQDLNPVDAMIALGTTGDLLHHIVCLGRHGRRTEIEAKSALTHAMDGSVRGLAVVMRDLTLEMRAQAESNRLAAIVESSFDPIIGKTLDGRITNWNRAAEALFGYTEDEIVGRHVSTLIPPDRRAEEGPILAKLARGEPVLPFDTVRVAKDGRLLEVSVTQSPIHDAQGRTIGASKIMRDVSEQRRAEAALRSSEERLRFTLEAAQIGDWELDIATGQTWRSLRHDRCFGYEQARPDWSFDIFLGHIHPDDRADVMRSFDAAVGGGTDLSFECRVVWPDGSLHWIAVRGRVQHDEDAATRMLGIVTETTEQRLAEQARLKAVSLEAENRQIQEASRLKSEFLANMSHELRTPLNAIIGFADLLHAGQVPPESPKHKIFLDHIRSSGRHLLQLINDIHYCPVK
jgi:PAS domain S-box-containing protein